MPKLLRDVRALNETKALVLEPGTAIDEPPLTKHSNSQSLVVPSLELLALQVITGRIMSNYITSIWGAGGWDDILEENLCRHAEQNMVRPDLQQDTRKV